MKDKILDIIITIMYVIGFTLSAILFIPLLAACIILMPLIAFLGFIADALAGDY